MNRKGQLSLINIIFFVILAFILAISSGIINSFLNQTIIDNNYTGTTAVIINMIVPLMWLGLVVTFFLFVTPIRPQQY